MKENKTAPTDQNVVNFLSLIPGAGARQDCQTLDQIMREVTGCEGLP